MTLEFVRTTGADDRSIALRTAMDRETYAMYEDEFAAMDEATLERVSSALATNQGDLVEVVIALDEGGPVGHAALRALEGGGFEVKKLYVAPAARGRGLSRTLMTEIEDVARQLGETSIRLQTGSKQAVAISLYETSGYRRIAGFGPYAGIDDLVCFEKSL